MQSVPNELAFQGSAHPASLYLLCSAPLAEAATKAISKFNNSCPQMPFIACFPYYEKKKKRGLIRTP
jgi:hypothetical protein